MLKKINNYHLSLLLMIVFILNTILFQSIKITQGQHFEKPTVGPGGGTGGKIITSPLKSSLKLGGFDIIGEGNINIDGKFHLYGGDASTDWKFETGDGQPGVHIISGGGEYNDPFLLFQAGEDASSNRASIFMNSVSKKLHLATQETIAFTIDVNSNIGIGTIAPQANLDIQQTDNSINYEQMNWTGTQLRLKNSGGSNGDTRYSGMDFVTGADEVARIVSKMNVDSTAANTYGDLRFLTKTVDDSYLTERMIIDSSGNVGIGIDPDIDLEVLFHSYKADNRNDFRIQSDFIGTNPAALQLWGPYSDGETGKLQMIIRGDHSADYYKDRMDFSFFDGTVWREAMMRFNRDGTVSFMEDNVGIGIEQPNANLHIYEDRENINAEINLETADSANGYWGIYHDKDSDDLRFWHNGENRLTITETGSIMTRTKDTHHFTSTPWYNVGQIGDQEVAWEPGYIKLKTPIMYNESNMFSINIKGYRYGIGGTPVDIMCGGYAYGGSGNPDNAYFANAKCNTEGTSDPVGIGIEDDKVIITIGDGGSADWYYDHFTFEYVGWKYHHPDDFTWEEFNATASPTTTNQNLVTIDDAAGSLHAPNLHTHDINLSNKDGEPNEVDGTQGSWTIQEGDENLFLINRNTGEKYKFMLDKVE